MTKSKKPEPNPIEEAIGERATSPAKLTSQELQKAAEDVKKEKVQGLIPVPLSPSEIPDEPSPPEMLTLEELNRQTEERLRDQYPAEIMATSQVQKATIIPVSKPDPQPVTKTFSQGSPPQEIEAKELPPLDTENELLAQQEKTMAESLGQKMNEVAKSPAEDIELIALKKYIREDGFVLATVAFHIVSLCAEPLTTPTTTTWDFKDRAMIPDMVLALLNQPGYIEGIWPSLRIVMGSNKGNAAWCAGISTTIAFFDVIRTLPAIKELNNEEKS